MFFSSRGFVKYLFRSLKWSLNKPIYKDPVREGYHGESEVCREIESLIRINSEYDAFNDITLKTPDGTTQIDHIIISPYGIFVVETKNLSGWIFGNEKQKKWTQVLYRDKYRFQNPQ